MGREVEALKSQDLRAALGFLKGAYAIHDYNIFGRYLVSALPKIVTSEAAGFHPLAPGKKLTRVTKHIDTTFLNPPDLLSDRGAQFYAEHYPNNPLVAIQSETSSIEVVKISDFFNKQRWQRLDFYNEVFRPHRLWDQILFSLAAPGIAIMNR